MNAGLALMYARAIVIDHLQVEYCRGGKMMWIEAGGVPVVEVLWDKPWKVIADPHTVPTEHVERCPALPNVVQSTVGVLFGHSIGGIGA